MIWVQKWATLYGAAQVLSNRRKLVDPVRTDEFGPIDKRPTKSVAGTHQSMPDLVDRGLTDLDFGRYCGLRKARALQQVDSFGRCHTRDYSYGNLIVNSYRNSTRRTVGGTL